jgi:hypothetical protein
MAEVKLYRRREADAPRGFAAQLSSLPAAFSGS